ncbi:MAG: TetR/AcrR family transcriptional regulator [Rhodospirillales bacterium]|nr:TetR/AcrR family transcriptional regulator [Rhodospirillales bacterium]
MNKQDRILDAAIDVFVQRGYADTRMDEVAEKAGVAKGTVYLHFASKEALFEAVIENALAPIREALEFMDGNAHQEPVDAEALHRFYRKISGFVETGVPGAVMRLVIAESGRFPGIAETYFKTIIEPGLGHLSGILDKGAKEGTFRGEMIREHPMVLIAPVLLAVLWKQLFQDFKPLDTAQFLDTFADMACQGLIPERKQP